MWTVPLVEFYRNYASVFYTVKQEEGAVRQGETERKISGFVITANGGIHERHMGK